MQGRKLIVTYHLSLITNHLSLSLTFQTEVSSDLVLWDAAPVCPHHEKGRLTAGLDSQTADDLVDSLLSAVLPCQVPVLSGTSVVRYQRCQVPALSGTNVATNYSNT